MGPELLGEFCLVHVVILCGFAVLSVFLVTGTRQSHAWVTPFASPACERNIKKSCLGLSHAFWSFPILNASVIKTTRLNRNLFFLLFLFLPALAIQGFFSARFLWGSDLSPLKGFRPGPHDFAFISRLTLLVCSPTMLWVLLGAPTCLLPTCMIPHLSPICPSLSPSTLWVLRPHDFIHSSRVMVVI